jgi:hypothetical protein
MPGIIISTTLLVTMDTYVQAVSDEKRKAHGRAVEFHIKDNALGIPVSRLGVAITPREYSRLILQTSTV